MVGAFGFAFHYNNVRYVTTYNSETWNELHVNGNPEVLKDAGHILGLTLNVGGNIQAYGYDRGYCAGLGNDMAEAWMEEANVTVDGDIILDLQGNNVSKPSNMQYQYVFGLSDELMNLTNSNFTVNNIILHTENIGDEPFHIGAWARDNSHGNYINLKNNTITVKGKMEGITDQHLLAAIGFENDWNSNGTDGVDWLQENDNNTFNIGEINLQSDKNLVFTALAEKWRTGNRENATYTLPSASLKNNTLNCGDVSFKGKNGVTASLMMYNSSNAKNNNVNYGNVNVEGGEIFLYGMGNLRNDQPKENFYENIAENNNIALKDLTVTSNNVSTISLMVATQDEEQKFKNCTVKAGKVNITLNSDASEKYSNYVGGIATYSLDEIDSARVFVDSVNVVNKGPKRLYFGLGVPYKFNSAIKNSGVFVDSDVNVTTEQNTSLFGGGFVGYANNAIIENNNFQISGKNNITGGNVTYGGFAGWIRGSKLKNNSSLFLNEYMPCIGYADQSGSIEYQAHYINEKPFKYFSGLLAASDGSLTIKNSTLLVPKEAEDSILYRKDNVSEDSKDNYVVVVDNEDDFNRKAYKVAEITSTVDEMGKEIPVFKKTDELIGAINIMGRSFQDKYWNADIAPYEIEEDGPEKDFDYMTGNDKAGTISVFGIDSDKIISNEGKKGHLDDYYHRHAGLISDSGVIYDLLGIKGSLRFSVLYDGNGADGGDVPKDNNAYKSGDSVTVLSKGNLSRTGYKFIGWNTEADGSGTAYKAGDTFIITENTTLYAQWEKESSNPGTDTPGTEKVKLTFDPNGGVWTWFDGIYPENPTVGQNNTGNRIYSVAVGQNFTIIDAPTREGYTFLYWKGSEHHPGDKYTVTGPHTFTAVWEKEEEKPDTPDKPDKPDEPGTDPYPSVPILPPGTDLKPSIPIIPQAGAGR